MCFKIVFVYKRRGEVLAACPCRPSFVRCVPPLALRQGVVHVRDGTARRRAGRRRVSRAASRRRARARARPLRWESHRI